MMTMMIIVVCIRLEKVSRRYNVKLLVKLLSWLLFGASERSCQSTRTKINSYSWPLVTTDPILRRTSPSFS